jgi:hypothetical protein
MPRQPLEDSPSHGRSPGFTGAVVLVLLGLYVASYVAFVTRRLGMSFSLSASASVPTFHTPYSTFTDAKPFYNVPAGIPQALPQLVFYPAYQIDRWIRPGYWYAADALTAIPVPPPPGSP